jgi:hypothetical protein
MMIKLAAVIALVLWLPMMLSGAPAPQAPPTDPIVVPIPHGMTAHLENPNIEIDCTGAIFATTRPNSGVGSFVWMVKDGQSTMILDLGPEKSYALAEFFIDQRNNALYFTTVEKEDHTFLIAYPIKEWTASC